MTSSPVRYSTNGPSPANEKLLLTVLNSTPVIEGTAIDYLSDLESARDWLADAGEIASEAELAHLRHARTALQAIVRGERATASLAPLLRGVSYVPAVGEELTWTLRTKPERELAVRTILAWHEVMTESPGRLRPCANDECRLFLIDHSKANRARWCSMAICGNRMKARRHYQRTRGGEVETAVQVDHKH